MTLRETKMERTRDLITEVALALFRERGYADTTVEQVAAAAEVGTRTVYRYYPTKESLVFGLYVKMLDTARTALRECPAGTPIPDALGIVLESILQSHLDRPGQMLAAFSLAQENSPLMAYLSHLLYSWQQDLVREVSARLSGRSPELVAGLAVAQTATVFRIAFEKWAESDARADLRALTNSTLKLLRSGDVPLASLTR